MNVYVTMVDIISNQSVRVAANALTAAGCVNCASDTLDPRLDTPLITVADGLRTGLADGGEGILAPRDEQAAGPLSLFHCVLW